MRSSDHMDSDSHTNPAYERYSKTYDVFLHYNKPARIAGFITILSWLALLVLINIFSSAELVIIALMVLTTGISVGVLLRRKAKPYKLPSNIEVGLIAYTAAKDIDEYFRDQLEYTRQKVLKRVGKLGGRIIDSSSTHTYGYPLHEIALAPIRELQTGLKSKVINIINERDLSSLSTVRNFLSYFAEVMLEPTSKDIDSLVDLLQNIHQKAPITQSTHKPSVWDNPKAKGTLVIFSFVTIGILIYSVGTYLIGLKPEITYPSGISVIFGLIYMYFSRKR